MPTMVFTRLVKMPTGRKLAIFSIAFLAYWISLPWMLDAWGIVSRAWGLIFIVLAGLFWGFKGGILVAALSIAVGVILLRAYGLSYIGGFAAPVIAIATAGVVGRLTDLSLKMEMETHKLRAAELELKRHQDRLEDQVEERTRELIQANRLLKKEIRQRSEAEEQRRELESQLFHAQKMETVGNLAGGIAHDFNNILQIIQGFLQLALDDKALCPETRQNVQIADRAAKRAGRLIAHLMTFSRRMEPELSALDLNAELENTVSLLRHTIPKTITIETSFNPDTPTVEGDQALLEQIVLNLASNAVDAMPQGGRLVMGTERVQVDSNPQGTGFPPGVYALLSVSDNGCGMTEEEKERIFEPFFSTKEVGRGTGLGLSAVFGAVKTHKGFIECESAQGEGTTLKVFLPQSNQIPLLQGEADVEPENEKAGHETIMIIDDEPEVRQVAVGSLSHLGYRILESGSAEDALARLERSAADIDLIILDLGMPGMSGQHFLDEIKKLGLNTKVIVASGYTGSSRGDISGYDVQGVLDKPYRLGALFALVRRVLDQKGPEQA